MKYQKMFLKFTRTIWMDPYYFTKNINGSSIMSCANTLTTLGSNIERHDRILWQVRHGEIFPDLELNNRVSECVWNHSIAIPTWSSCLGFITVCMCHKV